MAEGSVTRSRAPFLRQVCVSCGKSFMAHATVQVACSEECKFEMYQGRRGPDDCWEWTGPLLDGYGLLFLNSNKEDGRRQSMLAHRYSYVRTYGPLTDDKPCVLHSCDNPKCTNPRHLRAGTRGENNAERSAKGRSGARAFSAQERARYSEINKGEKNNQAKLTDQQAREIKYGHAGMSAREVSEIYGVSRAVVQFIRSGRSWRHV